jgi:hypothetical protein
LESDKYNINITWWVDATPLDRWHDPNDVHIGEHTNHILAIVNSDCFQQVMSRVKMGWKFFLRTAGAEWSYNGLIFDPYGMCRSVALARIIHHCLKKQGATTHNVLHLSKEWWSGYGDCGRCEECRTDEFNGRKEAALKRAWDVWLAV